MRRFLEQEHRRAHQVVGFGNVDVLHVFCEPLVPELLEEDYPFSTLKGGANVLVFPDLGSANIAYKLMLRIGGAEALGPILVGMSKPVHVLQRGAAVDETVNMAAIAVAHGRVHEAVPEISGEAASGKGNSYLGALGGKS